MAVVSVEIQLYRTLSQKETIRDMLHAQNFGAVSFLCRASCFIFYRRCIVLIDSHRYKRQQQRVEKINT